jgi:hypothetical protein
LTLLLPLFGLGGSVYLIGAGLLGAWLLAAAWKVWKQGGNKLAWKMYRYSSMYLAFLFALMIDRFILKLHLLLAGRRDGDGFSLPLCLIQRQKPKRIKIVCTIL